MNRSGALIVGVFPLLIATAAFAQTRDPQITGTVQAPEVRPGQVSPSSNQPPLFTIGRLPARVWAPVPPPYDVTADRNGAADPLPLWDEPE
jgi:hypothetical protein